MATSRHSAAGRRAPCGAGSRSRARGTARGEPRPAVAGVGRGPAGRLRPPARRPGRRGARARPAAGERAVPCAVARARGGGAPRRHEARRAPLGRGRGAGLRGCCSRPSTTRAWSCSPPGRALLPSSSSRCCGCWGGRSWSGRAERRLGGSPARHAREGRAATHATRNSGDDHPQRFEGRGATRCTGSARVASGPSCWWRPASRACRSRRAATVGLRPGAPSPTGSRPDPRAAGLRPRRARAGPAVPTAPRAAPSRRRGRRRCGSPRRWAARPRRRCWRARPSTRPPRRPRPACASPC